MPITPPQSVSIIPPGQANPGNVKVIASQLRKVTGKDASLWAAVGDALGNLQRQADHAFSALQSPLPFPNPLQITAADGSLIAVIGSIIDPNTNTSYSGIWGNNLFIGGGGPASAPFYSNGTRVVIGQNGQVYVLDPYANVGAWIGTQSEATKAVTGAVSDAGQIELTVTGHGYRDGDWVNAASVGGVPNATGQWVITVVDANHITLVGSTFAGAYTSGGTVGRFFAGGAFETIAVAAGKRITNAVNNGSGLVRLTITAHGYSTGYAVTTTNVVGVTGANGTFLVTVINANTVDLQGSTFSGAYVSGGISINWPTAKFLAQGDGSLLITDAHIHITGSGGIIDIDPVQGRITVTSTAAAGTVVTIQDGITIADGSGVDNDIEILGGVYTAFHDAIAALASSIMVNLSGYTGATQYGPLVSMTQYRGTPSAATASQSGDTLGGLIAWGFDGTGESEYAAGVRAVATENHAVAAHGAKLVFEITQIGNASPVSALELSEGVASTYNTKATAGVGLVPVYAAVRLTAQTTSIGTTNLRVGGAVAPAGLYRVTVYVKTTTASGADTLTVTIGWNDGVAARTTTVTIQLSTTGAGGFGSGQVPIEADGANDITYATTRTGATGTPQYSLRVTLEQLTLT